MSDHTPAPPAAEAAHGHGRLRFQVLHHLLAAALMASAMLTLERLHWMDWLDAVMLSVVGTEAPDTSSQVQQLPQLVLIDAQAYAENFRTRSPLDREVLGQLLGEVISARPASLMVDLQLEPAPGEPQLRALDQLLAAAARPAADRPAVRITLPLPISRTPTLDQRSLAWMRQLCDAGIQFGTAELRSHFGSVVRLDRDPLSLAQAARPPEAVPRAEGHGHAGDGQVTLCGMVRAGAALDVIWGMLSSEGEHPGTAPLDPALVKQLDALRLNWRPGQTAALLKAGGIVVVGGAYDSQDSFVTSAMAKPLPGALLHASGLANQGRDGGHFLAWLVDVAIGTGLGWMFAKMWKWVGTSELPSPDWGWRNVIRAWSVPIKAVVPWAFAGAVSYGFMKAAGLLMAYSFWLNPGPMVLGMLLHTLLLKDEEEHPIPNLRVYTQHHPAWPLQLLLIVSLLAFGPSGHH